MLRIVLAISLDSILVYLAVADTLSIRKNILNGNLKATYATE